MNSFRLLKPKTKGYLNTHKLPSDTSKRIQILKHVLKDHYFYALKSKQNNKEVSIS